MRSPTIHVASKYTWPSPRSTPDTYIRHVLYLIDISWSDDVLQRFSKAIVFLYDRCLVPHTNPGSPN